MADITEPVGTILPGKNLATGFIPHWAALPEGEAGGVDKMNRTPKVVFSRSAAAPD